MLLKKNDIAKHLRAIAKAEEHHEGRFKKTLKEVEAGTVFKKEGWWICRECGYIHFGKEPSEECLLKVSIKLSVNIEGDNVKWKN